MEISFYFAQSSTEANHRWRLNFPVLFKLIYTVLFPEFIFKYEDIILTLGDKKRRYSHFSFCNLEYLHTFTTKKGCGSTRVLEILSKICRRVPTFSFNSKLISPTAEPSLSTISGTSPSSHPDLKDGKEMNWKEIEKEIKWDITEEGYCGARSTRSKSDADLRRIEIWMELKPVLGRGQGSFCIIPSPIWTNLWNIGLRPTFRKLTLIPFISWSKS